jgi:uncharacterized protein (TIGR03083 family)
VVPGVDTATIVGAVARRTDEIVDALRRCRAHELRAPSALPDWDRLTIACHLRFGALAFERMTAAALDGRPVAYYPGGRERQRPATLLPESGESPADVVASLALASESLDRSWRRLSEEQWRLVVSEPDGQLDLGDLPLARLPILRLTEVDVHGSDLDLDLAGWSDVFVDAALPTRLDWLNTRRTNHRAVDGSVQGSWRLVATDRPIDHVVSVDGATVSSTPTSAVVDEPSATIKGSARDLVALLLGRPFREGLAYTGDESLAEAFGRAFPGP